MISISGMKLDSMADHSPRRDMKICDGMGVLRRIRILVRVGNWLLVRQPIRIWLLHRSRLLDRRDWAGSPGTSARNGNLWWQRHDGGILSVWEKRVADLLRRFVFISRHGVGFFNRWTFSVGRRFRYIWHDESPGNGNKQMRRHACSIGAQI